MIWQEIHGNWVLLPPRPIAIVHFLGGAFVATAPHVTYRWLLENLANYGYAIVATPFVNTLDHTAIAKQTMRLSNLALERLQTEVLQQFLPIYGIGHSMGCKLHLLIGSLFPQDRAGNILISYNNYPARRAIPFVDQFMQFAPPDFAIEFTPSPQETNRLIEENYQIRRNLLIKFKNDDIDQTKLLSEAMLSRFPDMTAIQILNGNHLTPLGQDVPWQAGTSFSPLDALAQFVRQEVYRDLNQLKRSILMWLDPLAQL